MTIPTKKKVYVGLSGGVDSAVSAAILKASGYDVACIYLKCWGGGDDCTAEQDETEAVKVSAFLGLPFEVWDFVEEYRKEVLDSFISLYSSGVTPNPDVLCNTKIKFGAFYNRVKQIDSSALVATGHYVRVVDLGVKGLFLASGADLEKDQSYFLHEISTSKEILQSLLFPIGDMRKSDVREYAKSLGLPNSNRPDSQGLCFIGDVNMRQFLASYINRSEGPVINKLGEVIGSHVGLSFYTIGQRHGFTVFSYHGEPLYVIGKSVQRNELVVGPRAEALSNNFYVSGLSLSEGFENDDLSVRVRNLGKKNPCKLEIFESVAHVKLKSTEFGIAPGQSAVFYKNDLIVGGGTISEITT